MGAVKQFRISLVFFRFVKISLFSGEYKYKSEFKGSFFSFDCNLAWKKLRWNLGLCKFSDDTMNIPAKL